MGRMFTSTALGNHMKSRSHDEAMAELYRSDPALALAVVNDILTDGDREELAVVLRQFAGTTLSAPAKSSPD